MFRHNKYDFFLITVVLFYLYYYLSSSTSFPSNISDAKKNFIECTKSAAEYTQNDNALFINQFQTCIHKHISVVASQMDKFQNEFGYERKMFLPLSKEYEQEKCKWLTIGIGSSIDSETLFKQKYPDCEIFGVEPISYENFTNVGTLIPHGVGIEDSEIELKVMVHKESNIYEIKKAKVISLTNLLDNYIKSRFIHYLTIDIEGFEYFILRELVGNGRFSQSNITFCQIDAELHEPTFEKAFKLIKNLNLTEFIINFVDETSPYIPIFSFSDYQLYKITFINYVDPECEKAFKFSSYFV